MSNFLHHPVLLPHKKERILIYFYTKHSRRKVLNRREFIRTTSLAVPALGLFPADLSQITRELSTGNKLEKRSLGSTGEMLSVIGFGGIIVMNASPEDASSSVKFAIDAGVNYFDVAPSYGDAEVKLGPALVPYRNKVFLSCKTGQRKKDGARRELEQSLKNLRTTHFDLYQLHAVTELKDVETILGKGGALETFIEAREEGLIRFIGFSAHSVEAALALMNGFDFDTIMFPVNFATWHAGNFGPTVLDTAIQKKMGIIALKAMAKGPWSGNAERSEHPKLWYEPLLKKDEIRMGLRFTLSHPVTTAITPGEEKLFRTAVNMHEQLTPLKTYEVEAIKTKGLKQQPLFSYNE
jgi:aryl-alcohol dehydrogenase-like predicted oxidoreductase